MSLKLVRNLLNKPVKAPGFESKQRLQRRLQKFSNAAQIFLAERTLLQDENQLLFKQNNEAKVRRSTKSTVIGKAKVMSWEDIEEAREKRAAKEQAAADKRDRGQQKRAAKEQATTDKGKRARKRKDAAPEVTEPKAKMARISEAPEAEAEAVRVPAVWISEEQVAPVARMY